MSINTVYWVSKGQHFPMCVKELEDNLALVESQVERKLKRMNKLRPKVDLLDQRAEGNSNRKKMCGPNKPIPKKIKRDMYTSTAAARTKKEYTKCAQWSPGIKRTHKTEDCHQWNNDGTPQHCRTPRDYAPTKIPMLTCV